ncbi:hypothetical protein ACWGS9_32240 [Bradyrhizobium sp. Arg314]
MGEIGGSFGRRGAIAAQTQPVLGQNRSNPVVAYIFDFLTADWKRITTIVVIAMIAFPTAGQQITESLTSPE